MQAACMGSYVTASGTGNDIAAFAAWKQYVKHGAFFMAAE
jgi:hypothetical protein